MRRAWLVAILALGCASAQTRQPAKVAAASPVDQAETAIGKQDWAAAETLLKDATSQEPKDYRAWFDLGYVYTSQDKTREAAEAYRYSVDAKPDIFESNLNLGISLAKLGNPDAAKYLAVATTLKPTSHPEEGYFRAWLSLGHVLSKESPQRAAEAYQQAAKFKSKDPEPHLSAAQMYEIAKDTAGAEREYQVVLALDPGSKEAITGLANIYLNAKRLPESETMLRKILAGDPTNSNAQLQLARVLAAENKDDDATAAYDAALKLLPNDGEAQKSAADFYLAAKKYKEAAAAYAQLVQAKPNDAALRELYGNALLRLHKNAEAQEQALIAIKLNPNMGEAYNDLAFAAAENKDYALSLKALDARAKFYPENQGTYFLRATNYDNLRLVKDAIAAYKKFLAVSDGKFPDQEWQARHRLIAIDPESRKK
ncbi:Tetratricopeptide repeat protein [Candidatus Koribacter versatilis Ellin345]|uniref:Tetratricopeptide repeat protein n=1 Tax=Koribacter versatilis (strain Ellin345) TaxID=204669 RepID=Q1IQ28_KORVE|nr:tetratricopeptide repeat protein [Candidatus Koribacter versatilis]ABF41022.1 Tetratricopeptide repeat protein [Candidatus Koribacter versatilis Ellin345]